MRNTHKTLYLSLIVILAMILLGTLGYFGVKSGLVHYLMSMIDENVSPQIFIISMIALPALGFPISIFLIVGSIKFGSVTMILIWLLILPLHTTIGFYVARFLRPYIEYLFTKKLGYKVPQIPTENTAIFSLLFLLIPGIPYAGKNYMLPLAGVPFIYCVIMNTAVQGVLGIPFIILGESATKMDMTMIYAALALIFVFYFGTRWVKKRYSKKI